MGRNIIKKIFSTPKSSKPLIYKNIKNYIKEKRNSKHHSQKEIYNILIKAIALLNKHSIVTESLEIDSIFTPDILDNCNSLSYKCYTTYTELQKEVDDAFKKAIERITNIISEI